MGALLILDPGLARFWQHDGDPRSPRPIDPEAFDLHIVGPDAITVGRAYDRQFDPQYLFDVVNVEKKMRFNLPRDKLTYNISLYNMAQALSKEAKRFFNYVLEFPRERVFTLTKFAKEIAHAH